MRKIAQQLIAYLLAISLIGCATPKNDQPKEYAYLAPFVQKDVLWRHGESTGFISKLSDRHLSELALSWGILDDKSEGVNISWRNSQKDLSVGDPAAAINSKGGRDKLAYELRRELISAASWFPPGQRNLEWHEIVKSACKNIGLNGNDCNKKSSFEVESNLFNKVFEKSWDKLTAEQRKVVIERTNLRGLSDKDRTAIIAASGSAALTILRASVAVSGFAFYTTMSSVISTTAGVIGVTLPFVVYEATSTVLGTLAGPVGWALAGTSAAKLLYDVSKPNDAKVLQMVISLHLIKARALEESKQKE